MKIKFLFLLFLSFAACASTEAPESSGASVSVLFLGDTHFGESYEVDLEDRYFMDQFSELFEASELIVANLETPLTSLEESTFEGEKDYIHWSDPELATKAFVDYGFDAFSLGNNHSMDFGPEGLKETLDALGGSGFNFFGAGENEEEASEPFQAEVFLEGGRGLSVAIFGGYETVPSYEKLGFYASETTGGVYSITQEGTLDSIRSFKAENPEVFVVVFPHWGDNYEMKDATQESWGHSFIDAGADLVIGQGAHLFQEVESYEEKWIVYGLGNFVFKAPGRYQKLDAAPYSVVARLMLRTESLNLRLYPIFCDNLITDYETRFVSEGEFKELSERDDLEELKTGVDELGFYFELPVN